MTENVALSLGAIFILGMAAQWFAWRLHLPAIFVLLVAGLAAGPGLQLIDPDALLGELTLPFVSLAVAVILFEGGLSLQLDELKETAATVWKLMTIGALITWVLSALMAWGILDFSPPLAILFGAILVVTGPTVIMPMLRHVRPSKRVGSVVKWEGIVNDPIGAILAVLVFEAILTGGFREATAETAQNIFWAIGGGIFFGALGAIVLLFFLKRHLIPDYLENPMALMTVLSVFLASNSLLHESGLLAVTLMGIILANQKIVSLKDILIFKETLRTLLISVLFIILAARLSRESISQIGWDSVIFLAGLIFIVRPVSVLASTANSPLKWQEKIFIMLMAPRGIVAAAVASVFGLSLVEQDLSADGLVPNMFFVILGTVSFYGLTAAPAARKLGLAVKDPQGCLILGAHTAARRIAKCLMERDIAVLMVDGNRHNIRRAKAAGLPCHLGNILSDQVFDELNLAGIGRMLAMTPNEEVNSLATLHFIDLFSKKEVYQLPSQEETEGQTDKVPRELRGRLLFDKSLSYAKLSQAFQKDSRLEVIKITSDFDFEAFKVIYGPSVIPLFSIDENDKLEVFTVDGTPPPLNGKTLISLVDMTEVKRSAEDKEPEQEFE